MVNGDHAPRAVVFFACEEHDVGGEKEDIKKCRINRIGIYEEFPFRLEYEIHGQKKVIEDTLICEYDGVGVNEGNGKYRKWKQRLASGREEIILLKMAGTNEIFYSPGPTRYYMGDSNYSFKDFFPDASITELVGGLLETRRIRSDELFKMYGIKLLKWEISPPIVNSFTD